MPSVPIRRWTKAGATFACIIVRDAAGTLVASIPISAAQYAGLSTGGTAAAVALGVSKADWESGRAFAFGQGMSPGDAVVDPDGTIRLKLADALVGAELRQDFVVLSPGEFSGGVAALTVSRAVLDSIDRTPFKIVTAIDSIDNGVLTWR